MTGLKAPAGAVTEEAALVPAGECGGHLRTSPGPLRFVRMVALPAGFCSHLLTELSPFTQS